MSFIVLGGVGGNKTIKLKYKRELSARGEADMQLQ